MADQNGNDHSTPPPSSGIGTAPYPAQNLPNTNETQSTSTVPYNAENADNINNGPDTPFIAQETTVATSAAHPVMGFSFIAADMSIFAAETLIPDSIFTYQHAAMASSIAESFADSSFVPYITTDMAPSDGYEYSEIPYKLIECVMAPTESDFWGCGTYSGGSTTGTTYYKMIGRDPDCPTLTYRSWVSINAPDAGGYFYTGPKCGHSPIN